MKLRIIGYSILRYDDGTFRWKIAWPGDREPTAKVELSGSCNSEEEAEDAARQAVELAGGFREF
jgi:hypothetical protein